jgi:hypothetical protein
VITWIGRRRKSGGVACHGERVGEQVVEVVERICVLRTALVVCMSTSRGPKTR